MSSSVMMSEQQQGGVDEADLSALAGLLLLTQERGVRLHLGLRTPTGFPVSCKKASVIGLVTSPRRCLYASRVPMYRRGRLISTLTSFTDITPVLSPVTLERGLTAQDATQYRDGWLVTIAGQTFVIKQASAVLDLQIVETVEAQQLGLNVDITQDQLVDVAEMLWESVARDVDRTVDYDPKSNLIEVPAVSSAVRTASDGVVVSPRRFKPFFGGEMPDNCEFNQGNVRIRLEPPCHEE